MEYFILFLSITHPPQRCSLYMLRCATFSEAIWFITWLQTQWLDCKEFQTHVVGSISERKNAQLAKMIVLLISTLETTKAVHEVLTYPYLILISWYATNYVGSNFDCLRVKKWGMELVNHRCGQRHVTDRKRKQQAGRAKNLRDETSKLSPTPCL